MRKFKNEAVHMMDLYSKCNSTVLRMEEPGCMLRTHYDLNEYYNRVTLSPCRCLGRKKKYFQNKKYLLADRVSQD